MSKPRTRLFLLLLLLDGASFAQKPRLSILLPERTRLLVRQRIDLVVEARNVTAGQLKVWANDQDITSRFGAPARTDLDCESAGLVFRADLFEFPQPGPVKLSVELRTSGESLRAERTLEIKPFVLPQKARNYVIFIGDAMGNAYRDAGRIV